MLVESLLSMSPDERQRVYLKLDGAERAALSALFDQRLSGPQGHKFATPGDLAVALDPHTNQTPMLQLIDEMLVGVTNQRNGRLLISCPPQEGKSQRVSRRFPLWALLRNPNTRIGIASYEFGAARRWGRVIRDDIVMSEGALGLKVRSDVSAQAEWQLEDYDGSVYTTGVGGALTGRPLDLLVIDDPVKDRAQADSAVFRDRVWDWWTDVASTRLAPGAPVALILTRWHHDDLAGRLLSAEDGHLWTCLNVPAQAVSEDDPLGRSAGEYLESARGRTTDEWEAIKVRSGSRTWSALYQGNPTDEETNLFPASQWQRYEIPPWDIQPDGTYRVRDHTAEVMQSWDMAFKDTNASDYVVGQVWARVGADVYLLDQIRGRLSFTATCDAVERMTRKWPQAAVKLVEDKANGPAVMSALGKRVAGMIPYSPQGSKIARATAVSPFVESGNVWLPSDSLCGWIGDFIDEFRKFPVGVHDDQVDAFSQALHRMLLGRRGAAPALAVGSTQRNEWAI